MAQAGSAKNILKQRDPEFKIGTWNVRGNLSTTENRERLSALLHSKNIQVAGIQETMVHEDDIFTDDKKTELSSLGVNMASDSLLTTNSKIESMTIRQLTIE
jgi:hypothetical protein